MNKKTHIICSNCGKKRLIKFFSSGSARKCTTCKNKAVRDKKKNSVSSINKKRDDAWSIAVKKRDNFRCLYCGKTEYINSHHIFSRSNYSLRWDIENGITLCSGHHTLKTDFSAHKTPVEFIEWLRDLWGDDWYERLRKKAKNSSNISK